jgi:hypothetical protein
MFLHRVVISMQRSPVDSTHHEHAIWKRVRVFSPFVSFVEPRVIPMARTADLLAGLSGFAHGLYELGRTRIRHCMLDQNV